MTRKAPDPMAPSVDHLLARHHGGSNDPENLQMAHLRCNQVKHLRQLALSNDSYQERKAQNWPRSWRKLAKQVRDEEPFCSACGAPSQCATRIVPLVFGGSACDRANVEALCRPCANIKAQEIYRTLLAQDGS